MDVLVLVPGGYPVTIDVAQATIDGAGTAMHFVLPLRGHNLPLMHVHETKLLVALAGAVEVRSGVQVLARLAEGEAVLLHAGVAHRVHQDGLSASTVGVALWPGAVEVAFRALAEQEYSRAGMIALLAQYDVVWNADGTASALEVRPWHDWLAEVPPALGDALLLRWRTSPVI